MEEKWKKAIVRYLHTSPRSIVIENILDDGTATLIKFRYCGTPNLAIAKDFYNMQLYRRI